MSDASVRGERSSSVGLPRVGAWLRAALRPESGPLVARWFHAALALVFAIAFASLWSQLDLLYLAGGLAPIEEVRAAARAQPAVRFLDAPTVFWWGATDSWLRAGVIAGVVLSLVAAVGVATRPLLVALTLLYLSYAQLGAPFTAFQWDNLLLECGLLAALLPRDRRAPLVHALLLLLWFKLYFESGIAKLRSPAGDWLDGSAMSFYYETAPLPTRLGWYAHNLPSWWHALESRAMLVVELGVPWLALFAGAPRRIALVVVTGFMLINLATANYGFFVYLSLALHLFLLSDDALTRLSVRLGAPWLVRARPTAPRPRWRRRAAAATAGIAAIGWCGLSLAEGVATFSREPSPLREPLAALRPFHLAHSYHLFAQITTVRVEPEFQVLAAADDHGDAPPFRPVHLHYKPGPLDRPPPRVAPHQPRVDFQLWFYGLSLQRTPAYVRRLALLLCAEPTRAQPLFATALPPDPAAVRLQFWRYQFTTPSERSERGDVWRRELVATTQALPCRRARAR